MDARPDIKGSYKKQFFGTPFHALMIGIYNYEKYRWGERQTYQKEMNIFRHIKEVNPHIKEVHTETVKDPINVNRVTLSKNEFETFKNEPWIVFCKSK